MSLNIPDQVGKENHLIYEDKADIMDARSLTEPMIPNSRAFEMTVLTAPAREEGKIFYPETDGKPMAESDFQRGPLSYLVDTLDYHYKTIDDVYVSGNLLIYYQKGDPRVVISPDVFVVFEVPKKKRRIYQTWIEGKGPDLVIEITSKTTRVQDETKKPVIYRSLGVSEYFQYDPTGDYIKLGLKGRRLNDEGEYESIPFELMPGKGKSGKYMKSNLMDLLLVMDGKRLRIYDPLGGDYLWTYEESQDKLQEKDEVICRAELEIRQVKEQIRAEARKRQDAEEQIRAEARKRQDAEEQVRAEARERRDAEKRIRELEALLKAKS